MHHQSADFRASREALGGDCSASELIERMLADFGGVVVTREVCAELLDWQREQGLLAGRRTTGAVSLPAWMGKFLKILRYIKHHPNTTSIYAVLAIWDEPMLDDLNGHLNQQQFADSIGLDKAAVNNAMKDAARHFGTPPRRDQRKAEACANMAAARIQKLEQTN